MDYIAELKDVDMDIEAYIGYKWAAVIGSTFQAN